GFSSCAARSRSYVQCARCAARRFTRIWATWIAGCLAAVSGRGPRCKTWNIASVGWFWERRKIGSVGDETAALRDLIRQARHERPLQPGDHDELLRQAGRGDKHSQ